MAFNAPEAGLMLMLLSLALGEETLAPSTKVTLAPSPTGREGWGEGLLATTKRIALVRRALHDILAERSCTRSIR
jgi:hypothetical protein